MKQIVIDFAFIQTPTHFYRLLEAQLALPPYFGRNLDALWDVVTSRDLLLPVSLEFRHVPKTAWCQNIVQLFEEAAIFLGKELQFHNNTL